MNKEILLVVDSVSNEKSMDKEVIFRAIERALETVTAKRYQEEVDIKVVIDRKTGDYESFRHWVVVNEDIDVEFPERQISLNKAKLINDELEVGDIVEENIESVEFGRVSAQLAKQVITREIRHAEKEDIVNYYKKLLGTLISGTVKKVTRDYVILEVNSGIEAIILKDEMLPKEALHLHDRVRGILTSVREDGKGPMLVMSRNVPQMLIELFKLEVPEIGEDIISIKGVARDPGIRAKIAVKTNDGRIDPIGACIGIRGARVQNVSNELGGERIDVILWDDDTAQMVINAMASAEISSIIIDEAKMSMEIIVKEDQLALAIGRNGQNIRLASELTGWKLNVISTAEAKGKTKKGAVETFVDNLSVDKDLADILVQEGFRTLEDIAYSPIEDLIDIEGFDRELAEALKNRARDAILKITLSSTEDVGTAEPSKELLELDGMSRHIAYVLASKGIITRDDLADQSVDDLTDIKDLSTDDAAKLIMAARKYWFDNENN